MHLRYYARSAARAEETESGSGALVGSGEIGFGRKKKMPNFGAFIRTT